MIVGVGLDVIEVDRLVSALARHPGRFEARVFTAEERRYATQRGSRSVEHLAARFAAKEATLKALGVPPGARWHDMEVVSGADGRPSLVVRGVVQGAASALGVGRLHLSLTHTAMMAAAVVVAEAP
jgi:holo-[acyl-carrier protein] synthase